MECKEFKELISEYIDGALPKDRMQAMEQHLELCIACKREYEELARVKALLGETKEVPLPANFDDRMKAALAPEFAAARAKTEAISSASKGKRMRLTKRLTAVAAVLVVGLFCVAIAQNDNIIMQGFESTVSQDAALPEGDSSGGFDEAAENAEPLADDTGSDMLENELTGAPASAAGTDSYDDTAAYDNAKSDSYTYSEESDSDLSSGNSAGSSEAGGFSKNSDVSAEAGANADKTYDQAGGAAANAESRAGSNSDKSVSVEEGASSDQMTATTGSAAGDKNSGKRRPKGHKNPADVENQNSLMLSSGEMRPVSREGEGIHKARDNAAFGLEYYKALIAEELSGCSYEITGYSQTDQERWVFVVTLQEAENAGGLVYKGENGKLTLVDANK